MNKWKFGLEENDNYTLGFVRLASWGLSWLSACEWVLLVFWLVLLTAGSAGAMDGAFVSHWQEFVVSVNAEVHLDIK